MVIGQKQRCERQYLLTILEIINYGKYTQIPPNEMPEPLTRTRLHRKVMLGVTREDNKIWKTNKINDNDYSERIRRRMFL